MDMESFLYRPPKFVRAYPVSGFHFELRAMISRVVVTLECQDLYSAFRRGQKLLEGPTCEKRYSDPQSCEVVCARVFITLATGNAPCVPMYFHDGVPCSLMPLSLSQKPVPFRFLALLFGVFLANVCQAYDPFAEFGVYCKTERFRQKINKPGCDTQKVQVQACLGTCASYSMPLEYAPYFKNVCSCCKASSTEKKTFQLQNCDPGVSPLVYVDSATGCDCQYCT